MAVAALKPMAATTVRPMATTRAMARIMAKTMGQAMAKAMPRAMAPLVHPQAMEAMLRTTSSHQPQPSRALATVMEIKAMAMVVPMAMGKECLPVAMEVGPSSAHYAMHRHGDGNATAVGTAGLQPRSRRPIFSKKLCSPEVPGSFAAPGLTLFLPS